MNKGNKKVCKYLLFPLVKDNFRQAIQSLMNCLFVVFFAFKALVNSNRQAWKERENERR